MWALLSGGGDAAGYGPSQAPVVPRSRLLPCVLSPLPCFVAVSRSLLDDAVVLYLSRMLGQVQSSSERGGHLNLLMLSLLSKVSYRRLT